MEDLWDQTQGLWEEPIVKAKPHTTRVTWQERLEFSYGIVHDKYEEAWICPMQGMIYKRIISPYISYEDAYEQMSPYYDPALEPLTREEWCFCLHGEIFYHSTRFWDVVNYAMKYN